MTRVKTGAMLAAVAVAVSASAVEVGDVLRFAGDGGLREVAVARRISDKTFCGSLDGYAGSFNATIVETDAGWIADIDDWRTRRTWSVVKTAKGTEVRVKVKPASRRCGCRMARRSAAAMDGLPRLAKKSAGGLTAGWEIDPVTNEVDVLVVFDSTAVAWLSSQDRTSSSFAQSQIDKMNMVLANSGLADEFKMHLCGAFEAEFDVTKDCGSDPDSVLLELLDLAVDGRDEVWKAIRNERERVGADIVMILANTKPAIPAYEVDGTIGVSYGLENDFVNGKYGLAKLQLDVFRDVAYGACDIRQVELDNTFSHEVGHIMGAGHSDILDPEYSMPGPQLFPYSSALMYNDAVDGEYYFTVMGYDSVDSSPDSPYYIEVPYYSSPSLRHPDTGSPLGDANHDNVRSLRQTYAVISQYRVRRYSAPQPVPKLEVPEEWLKARSLRGRAFRTAQSSSEVVGILDVKCGKANKKSGLAKISAILTGIDGKKKKFKARSVDVRADEVTVKWGDGADALSVTIKGGTFGGGISSDGGFGVASSTVGGELRKKAVFRCGETAERVNGLAVWRWPDGEPVEMVGRKWKCAKAAKVKWQQIADGSADGQNLCNLKFSYNPKAGTFKGSFKLYLLREGAVKGLKATAKITGVVVDGAGYGQMMVKKEGPWAASVQDATD